jgi:hypothetical protein
MVIGGAALSSLLHSPTAVRALTQGLRVPVTGNKAAAMSAFAAISRALENAKAAGIEAKGAAPWMPAPVGVR